MVSPLVRKPFRKPKISYLQKNETPAYHPFNPSSAFKIRIVEEFACNVHSPVAHNQALEEH